jgi:BirA family biotin operon repressor/biotin-[acetyl-CoA-carboxylase] ligase
VSPDFLEAHQQFYLNMAVSLGVSHAVGSCLPGQKVEVKWPNDIYVKRNKLAGILLQNSISGNCIDHSIVGVGLNVNQTIFSPAITNPGSLRLFSGHDLDRKKVLQDLLKNLNAQYVRIMNGDLAGCASDYHDILYGLHQWLQYKHGDRELTARIIGIEETGQLILETKEKERLVCGVKEIEYLF